AEGTAPLELERRPQALHHPSRTVAADHRGRDHIPPDRRDTGHPVPLPRQDPQPLGPAASNLTAGTVESPLRGDAHGGVPRGPGHGGFGEGPGETGQEQSWYRAPGLLSGAWTRRYWAFPRFRVPRGTILCATDPGDLAAQMRQVQAAATAPGQGR